MLAGNIKEEYMRDIQFCHKRKYSNVQKLGGLSKKLMARGGVTIALDLSTLVTLKNTLRAGDFVSLDAAVALCSDKDNYNKKVGRNVALGRLMPRTFQVVDITEFFIVLENGGINFTILVSESRLRFVSAE